jgi:hypothetical protein
MGPEVLSADLDEINKMFNPESVHENSSQGGISKENLNFELIADLIGIDRIQGLIADTVQAAIEELLGKIKIEISDRIDAVSAEADAREAADRLLQSDIEAAKTDFAADLAAEADAREAADDLLQNAVEAGAGVADMILAELDAEIAAREAGDASIESDLASETAARAAADIGHEEALAAEAATRAAAVDSLSESIAEKAPIFHASVSQTYGPADTLRYGHMRFATDAEAEAGTATDKALTPKQLGAGLAEEAKTRAAADTSLRGDVSDLRTDLEAWMAMFGTRTWQDVLDDFPTWGDVLSAGSWLKVYMKAL